MTTITHQRFERFGRTIFVGTKEETGKPTRYNWYIVDSTVHQGFRYTRKLSAFTAAGQAARKLKYRYVCNWCREQFATPVKDVKGTTATGPETTRCPHCGSNNIEEQS